MVADPFRMAFIRRLLVVAVLVAVTVGALSAMPGRAGAEQPGPISEHPWEITCIGATHAWETPDGGFNPAQVAFRARFTIVTDGVNRWFKEYPTVVTDPITFPGGYDDLSWSWANVNGTVMKVNGAGWFVSTDPSNQFTLDVACTNSFDIRGAEL
jgi:hypothetical protein